MKDLKKKSVWAGILILTAYGVLVSEFVDSPMVVMIADVISGLSVIGIALIMYSFFKEYSNGWSLGYLSLKIVEGLFMIIGGFFFLSEANQHLRGWIYEGVHLYVFIVSGFLFYYLLLKTERIPKYISIWGIVAILALFTNTVATLLGIENIILQSMLVLMITNEVYLAGYLMFKGLKDA